MKIFTYLLILLLTLGCKATSSSLDSANASRQEIDPHNSQNSLDWAGTYYGILPCADCMGIQKKVILKKDQGIEIYTVYIGKSDSENSPFEVNNNFKWDESGNHISVKEEEEKTTFKVEENQLRQLDQDGSIIEGELADHYTLKKGETSIEGRYWKAIEIMGEKIPTESSMTSPPYLIFRMNGELSGSGGCNSLFGNYEVKKKDWVSFSNVSVTEMNCDFNSFDQQLEQALSMAQQFQMIGKDSMQLIVGKRAPLAVFESVRLN